MRALMTALVLLVCPWVASAQSFSFWNVNIEVYTRGQSTCSVPAPRAGVTMNAGSVFTFTLGEAPCSNCIGTGSYNIEVYDKDNTLVAHGVSTLNNARVAVDMTGVLGDGTVVTPRDVGGEPGLVKLYATLSSGRFSSGRIVLTGRGAAGYTLSASSTYWANQSTIGILSCSGRGLVDVTIPFNVHAGGAGTVVEIIE